MWQVNNVSTAAGTASATATGITGSKMVVTSISATVAAGAAAQTPLTVSVIQDPTGTPVTLWAATLAAPANGCGVIALSDLQIKQTVAGKDLQITFSGNGTTNTLQSVAMSGGASA